MRVVLDCNILVICLSSRSNYHKLYKSLVEGKFDLIVSQKILLEYEEIIQAKYGIGTAEAFMSLLVLLPNVSYTHPYYKWNLIQADPDDNKYADCAVSGTADFLVSEDKHFSILKDIRYPEIKVISIDAFLELLEI